MVNKYLVARRMNLRPVNRIKHVVDQQTAIATGTAIPSVVANAVDAPTLASTTSVAIGSTINGFYITTEVVASESSTTDTPNFYWMFYKNPGNNVATIPNANAVGSSDFKKYVIHQEMVMIQGQDNQSPRNVFKGVIVVPKHMRRMGPGDIWYIQHFIPSTGTAVNACSQIHFKEFR